MPLPTPLTTSTTVVTGASSGIGADIARELAARGHGVTLVARREDPDARAGLFGEVESRGMTVDVLVNRRLQTFSPARPATPRPRHSSSAIPRHCTRSSPAPVSPPRR